MTDAAADAPIPKPSATAATPEPTGPLVSADGTPLKKSLQLMVVMPFLTTLPLIAIAVIGLGYVGLPLAVKLAEHFDVTGYDLSAGRVAEDPGPLRASRRLPL